MLVLRSEWRGPLVAVLAVLVAYAVRAALSSVIGPFDAPLQMFFLAVFVAAWTGGLAAGLLATALSVVVAYLAFFPDPPGLLSLSTTGLIRILVFSVIGTVFSVMSGARLRSQARETLHREELQAAQERGAVALAAAAGERERLQAVADHVPVILAQCDRDRRFLFANKANADRFGLQPSDMIGRTIADVLGAEKARELEPYIERVLAGERVEYEMTYSFPRTGNQRMQCAYIPQRDASGQVVGWIAALVNITKVRQAEAQVKNFVTLVETASDFIGISDLDFKGLYLNATAARMVGLSRHGVGDVSVFDFFYPEDREMLEQDFYPRVRRDGHASVEIRFRHQRTGDPLWMKYNVVLLRDLHGEPSAYGTISQDLTAQRQKEDQLRESNRRKDESIAVLREVADSIPQIFWSAAADGSVDYCNRRWYELGGPAPDSDTTDTGSLIHPDDFAASKQLWVESIRTGAPFEMEYRLKFPVFDDYRWYLGRAVAHRDESGEIVRWYATSTDIHDRKMAEAELRHAARQKDEFLGMLAHELRNPLAPIIYSVTALERQMPAETARRPLEVIRRQATRMTRIVDDLLDVSRVTQGKISLRRETLDLGAIVDNAAEVSRVVMDRRHHRLEVRASAEPLQISGDAVRLGQLFENLLSNAAKYTPPEGAISITVERSDGQGVVRVRDSGVGIAPDVLPRIFDLFVQAETTLDRAEGGLGIGLTLVDRIARLHGGTVEAHSEGTGRGSEFIVRLPLVGAAADAADGRRESGPPVPRRRFLIVDDNVDSAESLRVLLEMRGHSTRVVHEGRLAADAAREFEPDVVLLDVGLPGMDGYQVVRQFRESPDLASLIVVATTGYGRHEDKLRCLAAGFDEHIAKPLDIEAIEAIEPAG